MNYVAKNAVILVTGLTSVGGSIAVGHEYADAAFSPAKYEQRAENCLKSLGEVSVRGPMPVACREDLKIDPIEGAFTSQYEPVYDLPSRAQARTLPQAARNEAYKQRKDVGILALVAGFSLWGAGIAGAHKVRDYYRFIQEDIRAAKNEQ